MHAVVLISTDDTRAFEYLDLADALDAQPLRFSDVDFVKVWIGQVIRREALNGMTTSGRAPLLP